MKFHLTIIEIANRKAVFIDSNIHALIDVIFNGNEEGGKQSICGRDEEPLLFSIVLSTFEIILNSGKRNTDARIIRTMLNSMTVSNDFNRRRLFGLCRSSCIPIVKHSSILLQVSILENNSAQVRVIQDAARSDGILLWNLHMALDNHSRIQRRISSQLGILNYLLFKENMYLICCIFNLFNSFLVALLTHEHTRNSSIIRRIFPPKLIDDCMDSVSWSEFGVPTSNREIKSVSLLPEFYERVYGETLTCELVWGNVQRHELCTSLNEEMTKLEDERHYFDINFSKCITWNDEDFEVKYHSLSSEIKVGRYYLKYLFNNKDGQLVDINNPSEFLYHLF